MRDKEGEEREEGKRINNTVVSGTTLSDTARGSAWEGAGVECKAGEEREEGSVGAASSLPG